MNLGPQLNKENIVKMVYVPNPRPFKNGFQLINNSGNIYIRHSIHVINHQKLEDNSMANMLQRKWQEQSIKDKLYWMRSLFAAVGAITSTIIRPIMFSPMLDSPFMGTRPALTAAIIGVLIMIGLSTLVSYLLLKITPDQVGGWTTYFTTGLVTALFLWLVVWVLLYNIIVSLSPPISVTQIFQLFQFFLLAQLV
jgi:hypothetical protein